MEEKMQGRKKKRKARSGMNQNSLNRCNDIAVVGMACRFPGAKDYHQFWENLKQGISSIEDIKRWNFSEHYSPNEDDHKCISKWCGLLSDIDKFDNNFFNISPREAIHMDPQQRILLEETWHCIEDSGISLRELQDKRTSIYVGALTMDSYLNSLNEKDIDIYSGAGIYEFMLANRVSYFLNLSGESTVIEAACASAAVAVCNAKKALAAGESSYALVAGVNLHFSPLKYQIWSRNRMLSTEGKCKTFDKDANGYVSGEGVGVLLLQPLDKAIQDQNCIYGVIKGCAINHGGKAVSLSAPRVEAQRDVILAAYEDARYSPDSVNYIEAHGTGTSLGDPIEIEALTQAFRKCTDEKQFCKIGSVKTNIGHLEAAAGIAGIIKVLLMMQHKKIAPTLNIQTTNPIIDFKNSPFSIADCMTNWSGRKDLPLRAGVSSFGYGGVNTHILLEEGPLNPASTYSETDESAYPFVISAKNSKSLENIIVTWKQFVKNDYFSQLSIRDICLTLLRGREDFSHRCGSLIRNKTELVGFLDKMTFNISKTTENSWCLRVGEFSWNSYTDVEVVAQKLPIFQEKLNVILDCVELLNKGPQIRNGLFSKEWPEQFRNIYSFILTYTCISILIDAGLSINMFIGFKNGLWVSLVSSGAVSLAEALQVLFGDKAIEEIKLTRPGIPFYDLVNKRVVTTYLFDQNYISKLIVDLDISHDALIHYLKKARLLLENQFTFIGFLKEWDSKLKLIELDIETLLNKEEDKISRREKILLLVIILSSLYRMNQKWNLSEEKLIADQRFYELLDLVLDEVMTKENLIQLLVNENPDLTTISEALQERQNRINTKNSYPYLTAQSQYISEITDINQWFQEMSELKELPYLSDMKSVDFGVIVDMYSAQKVITIDSTLDFSLAFKKFLVDLWVQGADIEWRRIYPEKFSRISLPVYAFNRESFWLPESTCQRGIVKPNLLGDKETVMLINSNHHPLLHQNTSTFSELRFSSDFTGQEFFLKDHIVKGQRVFPGVAYLEMAREAIEQATENLEKNNTRICLRNIVWIRPIVVNTLPVKVHIRLCMEGNGEVAYEIYTESEKSQLVHSRGNGSILKQLEPNYRYLNIEKMQERCNQKTIYSNQCYEIFKAMGLDYGASHQGIEEIHIGTNQVLAKLSLPISLATTKEDFVLHPSMMDAALQASLGLIMSNDNETCKSLLLPFELQELEIFDRCTKFMWASICCRENEHCEYKIQKFDIDLCDEDGKVCVSFHGFSSRVLEGEIGVMQPSQNLDLSPSPSPSTMLLYPVWQEKGILKQTMMPDYIQHIVLLCTINKAVKEKIETQMEVSCLNLQAMQTSGEKQFEEYAVQIFETIQNIFKQKLQGKVLFQVVIFKDEQRILRGLNGLLKTASLENPQLISQLIEIQMEENDSQIVEKLTECAETPKDQHIRYYHGKRFITNWHEVEPGVTEINIPWREQGVYLVTGGIGGLGRIFAREIGIKTQNATLVLVGRSSLSESNYSQIEELSLQGITVDYRQVDVTQETAVNDLIQRIIEKYGKINGIIHGAGVIHDNFIVKKTKDEFVKVLAPKVKGLVNLDQASMKINLDFFVLFSSIAGSFGNLGQADYATANAFMDAYSNYRNTLVALKQRSGKTVSINWPLWKDGGMHVDAETEKMMTQSMGIMPLQTSIGINAFYQSLSLGQSQVALMEGDAVLIRKKMLLDSVSTLADNDPILVNSDNLSDQMQQKLIENVSNLLNVRIDDLDVDAELSEYGFDSITFTEFTNKLNKEYKLELTPTIFFEYPTIRSLTEYLIKEHQCMLVAQVKVQTEQVNNLKVSIGEMASQAPEKNVQRSNTWLSNNRMVPMLQMEINGIDEPIAIIGMSGRFPNAKNVDDFWQNLLEEKDCITEIPQERWNWSEYYGDPFKEANKTNVKWGGFIEGVDEFDPMFFGISAREAKFIDPQQRLLMIYVWKAIEDAGYSARSLAGSNTGIFVGTMSSGYDKLISQTGIAIEGYSATGMVPSVGPNRMSYFLDIHGPSEPIETACSSSLIAIHRAVNAIRDGSCDMAVVGGINTILTPEFHISFNKAGMLCEDGRCKTFSDQANGYVRGEGVGMIFLKKLSSAEKNGDHIYGTIRATAENHGGRANSLTSPNPKAQADLLIKAYTRAGIDPRTVTYIEAHGTGTKLGDPIEINGLKSAFKELYQRTGDSRVISAHCGLGSVKSNIGHLELASGIAGVIKVLSQLKHKTLVKSLHCNTVNPYIDLKESPFYIVRKTTEWKALQDIDGNELPRRAGISSFGFGGANAHVIIEEYIPHSCESERIVVTAQNPALIVMSARNEEQLLLQVQQILSDIQEKKLLNSDLVNIAYTLQVGREPMSERLAMIVESIEELEKKLEGFVKDQDDIVGLYRGQIKHNKATMFIIESDEDLQNAIDSWISKGKYEKLLALWSKGLNFDWTKLYSRTQPKRISLPTYPFSKERYWIPTEKTKDHKSNIVTL